MNEEQSDFFGRHSVEFIEMALSMNRIERVAGPDGYGIRKGDCGDTVECFLMCGGDGIESVSYWIQGCVYTIACCNTVSKLAEGKSLDAAWLISPKDIAGYLKTLPEDHYHCAELAVGALYQALRDLAEKRKPNQPCERNIVT